MKKPTLNDFYKEPREAYEEGFRLTWKHSILHIIEYTFIKSWLTIFGLSKEIVIDYLMPMLLSILKIIAILLAVITMPIFFPFWIVIHQLSTRKDIEYYFGSSNSINAAEYFDINNDEKQKTK